MKYTNIFIEIRLDIENTLSAYKKKIPLKEVNYELDVAYLKYLNNVLLNSSDFLQLYSDVKKKKLNKNIISKIMKYIFFQRRFVKKIILKLRYIYLNLNLLISSYLKL